MSVMTRRMAKSPSRAGHPSDRAMALQNRRWGIADARACMSVYRRIPDVAQRCREGRHMTQLV